MEILEILDRPTKPCEKQHDSTAEISNFSACGQWLSILLFQLSPLLGKRQKPELQVMPGPQSEQNCLQTEVILDQNFTPSLLPLAVKLVVGKTRYLHLSDERITAWDLWPMKDIK